MKPIILLNIDGVLNPVVRAGAGSQMELAITPERAALVRRLAGCGRIAWVSSWSVEATSGLEQQLQLAVDPLRVTLLIRPADEEEPTPKLRSVARWLGRMDAAGESDWDAVVWIDDVLGQDAQEWARTLGRPALLEKPAPGEGLTELNVVAVEVFAGME